MDEGQAGLPADRAPRVRRALISLLLVFTIVTVVSHFIFAPKLQKALFTVTRPYASALGIDQNWGVFAPEPRPQTIQMRARIFYADGTAEWWDLPESNALVGEYVDYRWRKWLEYIVNPGFRTTLFQPLAAWLARTHTDAHHVPVRIAFVSRWFDLYAPGAVKGPLRSDWREAAYYTVHVTPAMRRGV
jgi:hypothetical protein